MRENNIRDIPSDPAKVYKNTGWISRGDWLGTGRTANQNREFLPYDKARKYVCSLNLKNEKEWSSVTIGTLARKEFKHNLWVKNEDIIKLESEKYDLSAVGRV